MNVFIKTSIVVFLIFMFLSLAGIFFLAVTLGQLKVDPSQRQEEMIKMDYLNTNLGRVIARQDSIIVIENELIKMLQREKMESEYRTSIQR